MANLRATFERFADVEARGSSPLYEALSLGVADDPDLLSLVEDVPEDQPAPNLLFAAVQSLLFAHPAEPLADYFPSVTESPSHPETGAFEAFRRFCLDRREEVSSLLRSRRVQTNVIRRSSVLFPVFEYLSRRCDRTPLGLLEVGSSAGLNLLWDQYGYEYGRDGPYGDRNSPVQLSCEVRGRRRPPLSAERPSVGTRLGIDLNALDVRNEDDGRWLRALVWPEHEERRALLDAAISVAQESPPTVVEGDAVTDLRSVCGEIPAGEQLCIFNTHVLYQFTDDQQAAFAESVEAIGRSRDLFWVNCEWHGDDPEVHVVEYAGGARSTDVLARYDSHGGWIEWLPAVDVPA